MAERSSPTEKLYAKVQTLLTAVAAWLALDTGSMAAFTAATNALASETSASGLARASATVSQQTTTVTNDTTRYYKSFTAGASAALTGAGVMSAASVGDMWAFHEWPATVNVISGDVINETIDVKFEVGV